MTKTVVDVRHLYLVTGISSPVIVTFPRRLFPAALIHTTIRLGPHGRAAMIDKPFT
jgi:hypothetical protein